MLDFEVSSRARPSVESIADLPEPKLYIMCTADQHSQLNKRAEGWPTARLTAWSTGSFQDLLQYIHRTDFAEDYILICPFEAVFPRQILASVQRSIFRANRQFGETGWGLVGHAGVEAPSGQLVRFTKGSDLRSVPFHTDEPIVASQVLGSCLLLNLRALRARGWHPYADGLTTRGYIGRDLILSAQCYLLGLVCLIDWELFAVTRGSIDSEDFVQIAKSSSFRQFWTEHFCDSQLMTLHGEMELPKGTTGARASELPSYNDVVERVVQETIRERRSVSVVVRTTLCRNFLFERFLASFERFSALARLQRYDVRLLCVVNQHSPEQVSALRQRLRSLPADIIECAPDVIAPRVFSLLKAVEEAQTDYVWFVDDDDFIAPESAVRALKWLSGHNLVLGRVQTYNEKWGDLPKPLESEEGRTFEASSYPLSLSLGDNYTPICAVYYPISVLREALARFELFGDYLEDYALFLSINALKPNITVFHQVIAGVSLRNDGSNAVSGEKVDWDRSYATFMHELIRQNMIGRLEFAALSQLSQDIPSTAGHYHRLMMRIHGVDAWLMKFPQTRALLVRIVKRVLRV